MRWGRAFVDRRVAGAWLLLALGCALGERERVEPDDLDSASEQELPAALPEPEPPTYAERLALVPSDASEQQTVEALLYSYCGLCHGSDIVLPPNVGSAGMRYVDDIDRLISNGQIVPGDPASSKLFLRLSRGEMPPVAAGLPAAPSELVERVEAFITSLPALDAQ